VLAVLRQATFVQLWHPGILAAVLALMAVYLVTVRGAWRRRFPGSSPAAPRQVAAFLGGLATVYLAVGTPLDFLSDNYLFSAHMFEHALICFVVAPLLLLGTPAWLARPLLGPKPLRRALVWLVNPWRALLVFNIVFSIFHAPAIFDFTLRYPLAHFGEHAIFLVTALAMWWPVLSPLPELPRLPEPVQLLYLFVDTIAMTVVFAVITFAPVPLYPWYADAPRVWGLSALEDQQLGGIIMHMGSFAAYGTAFAITFFRWAGMERKAFSPRGELTAAGAPRR
jgi:putative membrane protein